MKRFLLVTVIYAAVLTAITLLASCPSRTLTPGDNLRMLASDANSAALILLDPEDEGDAALMRDVTKISETVVEVAAALDHGGDFSSVAGLVAEIDKVLARDGLDPKVRGALQILRNRVALLAPPQS